MNLNNHVGLHRQLIFKLHQMRILFESNSNLENDSITRDFRSLGLSRTSDIQISQPTILGIQDFKLSTDFEESGLQKWKISKILLNTKKT